MQGQITSVTVLEGGLDYSKASVIDFVAQGSGAEASAVVEYYNYNRYQQIVNNTSVYFDAGNGFVYEDIDGENPYSTYGYVCSPTILRNSLNDDGASHSPILGWAFDGNPIYGPYGYTNGTDASGGINRMQSGYVLSADRSEIVTGKRHHHSKSSLR